VWQATGDGAVLSAGGVDTEWTGGIRLDIPLFTGKERDSQKKQAQRILEQLTYEYDQAKLDVALTVRQSLEALRATRPTIRLSKEAAKAANNNYKLVSDAYNAGAVSIIVLIDAQAKKLSSDQAAVAALYDHLIQILITERSAGFFTFLMNDAEYNGWIDGFRKFVEDIK
jgi:outer membrane protein TolC